MSESSGSPSLAQSAKPDFELLRIENQRGIPLRNLPGRHRHYREAGHVYVIELSNKTIKAGFTANPKQRMEQHLRQGGPFQIKIVRLWLSVAHPAPAKTEESLLRFARQNCKAQILNEYFRGIDFNKMVRFASFLPFEPITEALSAELSRLEQEQHDASPIVQVTRVVKARMEEEARARAAAEPLTPSAHARNYLAGFFGWDESGALRLPASISGEESSVAGIIEQVEQLRDLNGQVPVDDPDWLDMMETLTLAAITSEFQALRSRAYRENMRHLWSPLRELLGDEPEDADDEIDVGIRQILDGS